MPLKKRKTKKKIVIYFLVWTIERVYQMLKYQRQLATCAKCDLSPLQMRRMPFVRIQDGYSCNGHSEACK